MEKTNFSNNKVIYAVKDILHAYPPCISQIVMLRELGVEVYVITEECHEYSLSVIENTGAKVKILGNLNPRKGIPGRIYHWIAFKTKAINEIKRIYIDGDIIWFGTERTGMVLSGSLKNKKTVLNVLELYDRLPIFKNGVKRIIGDSQVVVACELNRARIMRQWFNLNELPFVMPNKPSYEIICEKSDKVKEFQKILEGKKYILYQGILDPERPLDTLAQALNKTKENYSLVIIGRGSSKEKENEQIGYLKSLYDNVFFGGSFPAPQHLYITKNAYIGIAVYDTWSLNTMFCAPNKTFEYSKYKVPIIGNDIPGLQLSVEKQGAGICVDLENPEEIAKAIDEIADNYEQYQKGAEKLYNSVDNLQTMKKIIEKLERI